MTRRRFYAPPGAFNARHESVGLSEDEAKYLREVLRLKPGAQVFVFNGEGKEFQCSVEESRRDSARLKVLAEVAPARPESPLQLTLGVALLKGEKFDLVVQKCTELGAVKFVPLITRFADIKLRDAGDAAKRIARWQRIALEAAKQSGRAVVPEVGEALEFSEFAMNVPPDTALLMFSEREGAGLSQASLPAESQLLAVVGPEGGWAGEEIALAREKSWPIVTLGGRVLRAETAAIAITAVLQHLFGDLK